MLRHFVLFCLICTHAQADSFLEAGDIALRHHVSVLADSGLLDVPTTTWPLTAANVQLLTLGNRTIDGPLKVSINYLNKFLKKSGESDAQIGLSAANQDLAYTHFGFENEELTQLSLRANKSLPHFSFNIQGGVFETEQDQVDIRLDGSYVAAQFGNWLFGLDKIHRWWGPGWDGSLIYSNNAEPIPSLSIQRLHATAFKNRLLSWIGPWNLTLTMGQLEQQRVIANALFFTSRLTIKPTSGLEIGFSRAAQWGGEGRPQDFDTFVRMLAGKDNVGQDGTNQANQPGNQLAGFDVRWVSPLFRLPYAIYAQGMGEDEANGLPANYIGLFGVEWWTSKHSLYLETADTRSRFAHHDPELNVAYEHSVYRSGYRYRGRSIGHTLDGDGSMWSLGFIRLYPSGSWWQMVIRRIQPDLAVNELEQINVGLVSSLALKKNKISFGWQWTRNDFNDSRGNTDSLLAHVKWIRSF